MIIRKLFRILEVKPGKKSENLFGVKSEVEFGTVELYIKIYLIYFDIYIYNLSFKLCTLFSKQIISK